MADGVTWQQHAQNWQQIANDASASREIWKKIADSRENPVTSARKAAELGKLSRRIHELEMELKIEKVELSEAKARHASEIACLKTLHDADLLKTDMETGSPKVRVIIERDSDGRMIGARKEVTDAQAGSPKVRFAIDRDTGGRVTGARQQSATDA